MESLEDRRDALRVLEAGNPWKSAAAFRASVHVNVCQIDNLTTEISLKNFDSISLVSRPFLHSEIADTSLHVNQHTLA
jgi:hypothetical protein